MDWECNFINIYYKSRNRLKIIIYDRIYSRYTIEVGTILSIYSGNQYFIENQRAESYYDSRKTTL